MSFKIEVTGKFEKQAKRLLKKYPHLKDTFFELKTQLIENPSMGTSIGHDCYKIRVAIPGKNKGKSGGARVITHIYVKGKIVYLLSIYDKSEKEDVTEKELLYLLEQL